ncbi:Uncharacterised protein [Trueperella pyogenes]|nr:Uncharacterised protein [Trueperella pyogenes]
MKRAVACLVLLLAGCSAGADVIWSVPIDLGPRLTQVDILGFADLDDVVVVPTGQTVNGYNRDGSKLWTVTLGEDVKTCEPAGSNAMCSTRTRVFITKDGTIQTRPDLSFEGRIGDKLYYSRVDDDGVVLIEEDVSVPFDKLGTSDSVLARYEGRTSYLLDGTRVERETIVEPLKKLVDEGVLTRDSMWLNPPGIAAVAQPLADGFVILEPGQVTVSSVEPTTVTVFDHDGNETDRYTVSPALHMRILPSWTRATIGRIVADANSLDTGHAFVFGDARVVGFDQKLTDSVAPAFANIEELNMADGTTLDIDPVTPESLGLWVLDYPYVSVTGRGAKAVAATFDASTGERVVDGRCQLIGDTYCFSATTLEKVKLP